jgi:DNA-binding PadR family transcriptional regulator
LLQSPQTGYDLSKEFDEKVSCYWQATSQQIYRELARMEAQGWVAMTVIPQSGRPDKKLYALTELGQQELR